MLLAVPTRVLAALMTMMMSRRLAVLARGSLSARGWPGRGGAPLASVVDVQDGTHSSMSTPARRAWFVPRVIAISDWRLKVVDVLGSVLLMVFEVVGLLVAGIVIFR